MDSLLLDKFVQKNVLLWKKNFNKITWNSKMAQTKEKIKSSYQEVDL